MEKYKILKNGKMYFSENELEITSPESKVTIGVVPSLSEKEIHEIFVNAKNSFDSWKKTNPNERIKYLLDFAKLLLKNKEELASVLGNEIAKSHSDSIKEVERSYEYIMETIDEYKKNFMEPREIKENIKNGKVGLIEILPLGVVVCISPFNYPINLAISKIIPALILGNTVVFKPATNGSISGALLSKYFDEVKLPKNVFNIVTGKGSIIGDLIITNPNTNMISFTGGVQIGKRILEKNKGIPIVLELGGKDPAIILEDADIKGTIDEVVRGALSFSGQRCTAIKIIYVDKKISEEIIKGIVEEVEKLSIGKAQDNSFITSLVSEQSLNWAKMLIQDAKDKGAKVLCGDINENNLLHPTVLSKINKTMKIFDEEQFAPIIPIVEFNNIDSVIDDVNNSQFGLQASVFTKNEKTFNEIAKDLEPSTINWNKAPSRGPDKFPFTGIKNSGFGVQGIYWALESMSRGKLLKK